MVSNHHLYSSLKVVFGIAMACVLFACSPSFVLRAAWEEAKILSAREPLEQAVNAPGIAPELAAKLTMVRDLQRFLPQLGLESHGLFTTYAQIDRDTLLWVLMAARKDAFELRTWWFPVVGSVPYKGFFDKAEAERLAHSLREEGYETSLRTADAFSTLGWFNDPLLSTMTERDLPELANVVVHETFHANVWIPGNVPFNETAAQFVGLQGAIEFFDRVEAYAEYRDDSRMRLALQLAFADELATLYHDLSTLYASTASYEEKLARRQEIYRAARLKIKAQFPHAPLAETLNNATIMQWRVYLWELRRLSDLFEACGRSWPAFMEEMRLVALLARRSSSIDPFELVRERGKDCSSVNRHRLLGTEIYLPPE